MLIQIGMMHKKNNGLKVKLADHNQILTRKKNEDGDCYHDLLTGEGKHELQYHDGSMISSQMRLQRIQLSESYEIWLWM